MSKMMSVWIREGWVERYTWLGVGYLIVVSALQWSRGGPSVREPGTGSIPGAVSDLLAFYGAWYGVGLLLVWAGRRRATRGDDATRRSTRPLHREAAPSRMSM